MSTPQGAPPRCFQRVAGKTCKRIGLCLSTGLASSFCDEGLCMCNFGYSVGDVSKMCYPDAEAMAAMPQKDHMALFPNVLMFCFFTTMAVMVAAGSVVFFYRKFRAPSAEAIQYIYLEAR